MEPRLNCSSTEIKIKRVREVSRLSPCLRVSAVVHHRALQVGHHQEPVRGLVGPGGRVVANKHPIDIGDMT